MILLRTGALIVALLLLSLAGRAAAQSVEQRLDLDRWLNGLVELRTPAVLERYIASHPPAGPLEAALCELARARMALAVQAADAANPLSDQSRLDLVNRILQARRQLLALAAEDQHYPAWLADQASDILFQLLPIEGANIIMPFGVPTAEQRQRITSAVAELEGVTRQAQQSIDPAIARLESAPGYAANLQLQEQRRLLAQQQREQRIPFLRGVALVLASEIGPDSRDAQRRTEQCRAADALLAPLLENADTAAGLDPAILNQARLHRARALLGLKQYDPAEALLIAAAKDPAATPSDIFIARLTGVRLRAAKSGPAAGLEALASIEPNYAGKDALFFCIVIADVRFLLLRDLAAAAPAADRPARLLEAFAAYTGLLQTDLGVAKPALRAIIAARLADAASLAEQVAPLPANQLPPLLAIARAEAMARDAATRQQAITDLERRLADRSSLADADRAAALFILGRALYDFNQPLLAADRFIQLAAEHPSDAKAESAIELGATLAAQEHAAHSGDPQAAALLHHALDVLLGQYPNLKSIDRWRYIAGRLALSESHFDAAREQFARITPDSTLWIDAHMMQAAVASARAAAAADPKEIAAQNQEALAVINRMQPIVEAGITPTADATRVQAIRYYIGSLRVQRARALLNLNRAAQAVEALAGIDDGPAPSPEILGEALTIRINAYQALGKPDEALREVQAFIKTSPASAGATLAPMLDAIQRQVQALIDASRDQDAIALATSTMLPVAKLLETWLDSDAAASLPPADRAALGRRIADSLRLANRPEDALTWYDRLLKANPDASDLLLGRAESLYALGSAASGSDAAAPQRLADAMIIFKRLAAAAKPGSDSYWLAQLRMLQIIDLAKRNTEQILPRIQQLRTQDSSLGGERFRRGFDALRAKHQK